MVIEISKARKLVEQVQKVNTGVGSKTFLILDGGEQVNIAERLGKDVGKVFYFVPWYESDPKIKRPYIGHNLEGVEVIYDFWDYVKNSDRIFFPDCYYEDWAKIASEMGCAVIGSGKAAVLEYNKETMRDECAKVGLKLAKAVKVKGLNNLIKALKNKEGWWVKPVIFRGESETWQYKSELTAKARFDNISLTLGPFAEDFEFLIEEPIEGLEMGVDGITVNETFLGPMILGKTSGYSFLGRVINPEEVPEPIKMTNSKLLKLFGDYGARNFFGTEEMILEGGKDSIFLDLASRFSNSHVSGIFTELIKNFSEVLYSLGGDEDIVDPITEYTHVGSAVLVLSKEADEWVTIKSPKEMTNLKLEYMSKNQEGDYVIAPRKQTTCGAIIALGNSWDEVISKLQDDFEQLECSLGFDPIQGESKYQEMIEEVRSFGFEF